MPEEKQKSKGQNIFEFIVEKKDLEEARRVIRTKAEGKCLIGEEPLGNRVKLTVILYSDSPERDISDIMEDLGKSKIEIHHYRAGTAEMEVDF